ncbi:uncharacterized protein LOC141585963 [Silene latifolia]|uniref:uncharacterized protein LOC141585963 n=1 Tax=Silene latifolia TaxID=37657 RepID=UPI003D78723F
MGSEIEISEKLEDVMEVSPSMVEDDKPCVSPREELGNCESNREDDVFYMEGVVGVHDHGVGNTGNGEDLEVDVVGNVVCDDGEERVAERESQDATECSSSFGCTDSESGTVEASGDMEVESAVRDDNVAMGFDGCSDLFRTRKKKLADDWRNYVRPLMWRCKWVELKVRELQCQASKYAKELAECDKRKHCELENFITEDHAIKAAPYINQNRSVKLMKRKKRKRVEETVDLASYTSCHSLFSHFDKKKKSGADTAFVNNDHCLAGNVSSGNGEFSYDDELPSLHFKDSDAFESILRKIEEAQVHVRQLRMRMDKVVKENAGKFTSEFSRSAPRGQSTSFDPNSVRPNVNGEAHPSGSMPTSSQWLLKKPVLPGITGSISKEVTPPETIDDTKIGRKCNKIGNDILICNRPVKKERETTEDIHVQLPAEFSSEPVRKTEIIDHVPNPNLPGNMKMSQDQPTVKTESSSKKKRGRRKALTGRWSKRSSG